jgi:hypothetical protein
VSGWGCWNEVSGFRLSGEIRRLQEAPFSLPVTNLDECEHALGEIFLYVGAPQCSGMCEAHGAQ